MKVLFVSHDASRSGAPLFLLNFIKKLHNSNKGFEIKTIFIRKGELISEFKNYGSVEVINFNLSVLQRVLLKLFKIGTNKPIKAINKNNFDIVYINSVASIPFIKDIAKINCDNIVIHIHERLIHERFIKYSQLKDSIYKATKIIVVSNLVKNDLSELLDVSTINLKVIYPVINNSNTYNIKEEGLSNLLKNIPKDSFIVGGSGNFNFKKGIDVFIETARILFKFETIEKPIYFVWLGGFGTKKRELIIYNKLKEFGFENKVFVLPVVVNPMNIFNRFDLFYLTSMEESFGLAAFENGLAGNPIICFKGKTGIEEIINKQNGSLIEDYNADLAAEEILTLYQKSEILKSKSEQIKVDFEKVLNANFSEQIESFILS